MVLILTFNLTDPTEMLSRLSLNPNARRTASRASSSNRLDTSDRPDDGSTEVPIQIAVSAPIDELVTLPEGLLERKSSVRTMRRKVKFIDCLGEEVVQMGELES